LLFTLTKNGIDKKVRGIRFITMYGTERQYSKSMAVLAYGAAPKREIFLNKGRSSRYFIGYF